MRRINARILGTASFAALAIAGFASPAAAQDPPADTQDRCANLPTQAERDACRGGEVALETTQAPVESGAILVTGTRIRRPNLESTVPITSVGIQELTDTGDVSLGDNLNDLPSLRSSFSQGNSTRFIGTAGLNLLDLRGLGTARTLVLVNNRRHITASPGDYLVDVNTIPITLVERVDIVTGGNSAIYGSDAVAGVVNFILRRDFDGLRFRAQAGVSDEGDRGQYFAGLVWGRNFAEDRGNVAVALEYTKATPLYFVDRPELTGAYDGRCQFNLAEPQGAAGGETGLSASDGIPDNLFFCGVRNNGISNGGTIGTLGNGQALRFDPNGNLFLDTPDVNFAPFGSGNVQGGCCGATLRDTGQLAAGLQRYSANLLARFEVTRGFQPFLEAKYVHIDARQEGQPSFAQGTNTAFFTSFVTPPPPPAALGSNIDAPGIRNLRCNNPFLTAQALATLQSFGICGNVATGTFSMARFNVDFGGRGELHDRDTYRVVAGIEGDFFDDWHYEIAFNYGHLKTRLRSLNNLHLFTPTVFEVGDANNNGIAGEPLRWRPDGYLLAVDAQRNGAGQIVCGINADADPTNDRPDCVPINIFGAGRPSQAALDFVNTTGRRRESASEIQATAFVSGDLSQVFELPGGPIGFALGVEYRRETAFSDWDDLTQNNGTFLNAIKTFDPPALEIKEVYGEIRLPLLRDLPLAQELTVEAAARYSDYNLGNTNHTFAYNLGGTWAPIRDIRFRGNYSQSVRAPTQSDLFSPFSQNFAAVTDPCSVASVNNNPNRRANCIAFGLASSGGANPFPVNTAATQAACAGSAFPAPAGQPFVNCNALSFTTGFLSGGNPDLEEETARSYTLGVVIEPRFLPGFSMTADYYHINVKNLIAVLSAQTIINNCFDAPQGINNPFCTTVNRDAATGLFINPAVLSSGTNFARQITEGLDVEIAYRRTFGNGHRLSARAIGTYVFTLDNYTDPTRGDIPNRQRSELGDPVFAANFNLNYDFGALDITYNLRYIGKQTIGTYEAQNSFQGVCTTPYAAAPPAGIGCTLDTITTLPPLNADQFPQVYYPDVFYHSVRIGYQVNEQFSFYGGIDNIADRRPPLGLLGTAGGDPFDSVGRYFYAGVNVNFR
ncbi:MAG TPA: TonB-dependent receptor [Allosphingosinicella sp.]|nr:TonB-dependent receptor [Allosphingosinicella sp.]